MKKARLIRLLIQRFDNTIWAHGIDLAIRTDDTVLLMEQLTSQWNDSNETMKGVFPEDVCLKLFANV